MEMSIQKINYIVLEWQMIINVTLNAELLQVILYLKPNPNYLLHPKHLVLNAVKALAAKEGNKRLKDNFIELLNETNSD